MLDDGPGHRRRVFRPEGDRPAALVDEGVHFLRDDVGRLARALFEELGGLEDRGPQLAVAVELEEALGRGLDRLPDLDLAGEDVVRALDRGQLFFGGGVGAHDSVKIPILRNFSVARLEELGRGHRASGRRGSGEVLVHGL